MTSIYLAGQIQHHDTHGRFWREDIGEIAEWNGLGTLNPLDKYDAPADDVEIVREEVIDHRRNLDDGTEYVTPAEIVENDKAMIDDADGLFVRWEVVPTAGTPMEILYASQQDIPIAVWYEGTDADLSPWITHHADVVSPYPTECCYYIAHTLGVSPPLPQER